MRFRENSGFDAMGVRKPSRNANFLLESPIWGYAVPAGLLPAVSSLGSRRPSED